MDSVDGWYIGERAMKLCNARKACVIPVKLRQIDNWDATPFKDIQYLPKNGEPVMKLNSQKSLHHHDTRVLHVQKWGSLHRSYNP